MKRRMTKRTTYTLSAMGETLTTSDPEDVAYAAHMVPEVQVKTDTQPVLILA